jgi:hypothetical protein
MRPVQTTERQSRVRERKKGKEIIHVHVFFLFLALSSVAYAQKASGGNKEKGAAGAGEAVAHIELAAVTLMSRVIRRGFFPSLYIYLSLFHSFSSVSSLLSSLHFINILRKLLASGI